METEHQDRAHCIARAFSVSYNNMFNPTNLYKVVRYFFCKIYGWVRGRGVLDKVKEEGREVLVIGG